MESVKTDGERECARERVPFLPDGVANPVRQKPRPAISANKPAKRVNNL